VFRPRVAFSQLIPWWVLLFSALFARTAWAQEDVAAACEEIAARCPDAVVSEIRLDRREIFEATDPLPGWVPWKTVNRLHLDTTEQTIRDNLLFRTGERLDVERLRETQRKLNALGYFQGESITCEEVAPGEVRVDVRLKENWTLLPILDFQGRGQGTAITAGFAEQNLLGLGKTLFFSVRKGAREQNTIIEDAWRIAYEDPNLLGSEYRLAWTIEDRESGKTLLARFEKPYFSLETPWSLALFNSYDEGAGYLFRQGGVAADFDRLSNAGGIDLGLALKRGPPVVHRVWVFYRREEQTIRGFRAPAVPGLQVAPPPNYTRSYPGIGYRRLGANYIRERSINRFERDEYFNLAHDFRCSAGFSSEALGAWRDEWVLAAAAAQGFRFRKGHFFTAAAAADGLLDGDRLSNSTARFTYDHYLQAPGPDRGLFTHTLHAQVALAYGKDLDPDQVLNLGYTNGLRGYDAYAFTGSKLLRVTLEDRVFVNRQLFGLVSTGLLLFWDAGYVWQPGENPDLADLRHDVGFGIRAAVPATSGKNVVRLNCGFPLGRGVSPLQDLVFTVTVGSTFD